MRSLPNFRYRLTRDIRMQVEAQLQIQRLYPPRLVLIPSAGQPQGDDQQFDAQAVGAANKAKLN